jgi:hypothetical protein
MDSKLEKQFRERAVELGNSGDPNALPELIELTHAPAANVRRLAASAIGKLAGLANAERAVSALVPMLRDPKPQVRQYAVKALKAYGTASKCALSDLRDMAISPVEPEYNNRDAKLAVETIEEALRIAEKQAVHCCQRCGVELEPMNSPDHKKPSNAHSATIASMKFSSNAAISKPKSNCKRKSAPKTERGYSPMANA